MVSWTGIARRGRDRAEEWDGEKRDGAGHRSDVRGDSGGIFGGDGGGAGVGELFPAMGSKNWVPNRRWNGEGGEIATGEAEGSI